MVGVKLHGKLRICLDPVELEKLLLRGHYPLKTLKYVVAQIQGNTYFAQIDLKVEFC